MTFAAAAAFCSAKTINQAIPFDDTRHLAVTADDAIGLARRHALGAGVDEGLEFRFEMGFPGPSVVGQAFNCEHLELHHFAEMLQRDRDLSNKIQSIFGIMLIN